MAAYYLLAPIALPLLAAVIALLVRGNLAAQKGVVLTTLGLTSAASIALLIECSSGEIVTVAMGSWPAPYGIALVADLLSALMVVACNVVALVVTAYAFRQLTEEEQGAFYHPLSLLLILGVNGSLVTGDLFNLYVWFEVMLLASFVLLTLGRKRAQLEGALKYVALNLLASMLFLIAVGLLYGKTGTLNLADLSSKLALETDTYLVETTGVLLLVAFGIKAALFPFFFWLPAAYHTPPVAITAMFAGLLTKVGVYAIMRVFTLVFDLEQGMLGQWLVWIAGFTMVVGVLGAAAHFEVKRILSFHIVSQIGYMIMGLTFLTPLALGGVIFFVIHNMVAKTNLFLVAGMIERKCGTTDLQRTGGLFAKEPLIAGIFLVSAISLAGLPPFSGFWAKFSLVQAGFEVGDYLIVGVSLAVGIMTLFSMTKIWGEAFWKSAPENEPAPGKGLGERLSAWMMVPAIFLALMAIVMGLVSEPFLAVMERAGSQLLDPQQYIDAVLQLKGEAS